MQGTVRHPRIPKLPRRPRRRRTHALILPPPPHTHRVHPRVLNAARALLIAAPPPACTARPLNTSPFPHYHLGLPRPRCAVWTTPQGSRGLVATRRASDYSTRSDVQGPSSLGVEWRSVRDSPAAPRFHAPDTCRTHPRAQGLCFCTDGVRQDSLRRRVPLIRRWARTRLSVR